MGESGGRVPYEFLIIDDSAIMREMVSDFAIELGHGATSVCTGLDGVTEVKKRAWDLVFLDVHLPDLDGREVLKKIQLERPGQRVVLMTSDRGDELFAEAASREVKVCGFINKPFDVEVFDNCLKTVLTLRGKFTHRKEGYH